MRPSSYGWGLGLRGFALSGPPLRSLAVRPGDSLAIPKMALSMGFRVLVSLHPTIQATGRLAVTPVGLPPTERASLRWTHNRTCGSPASGSRTGVTPRHAQASPDESAEAGTRPVPRRPALGGSASSLARGPCGSCLALVYSASWSLWSFGGVTRLTPISRPSPR